MSSKPDIPEKEMFCGYCGERLPDIGENQCGHCPQCRRRFGVRRTARRPPPPPPIDWDDQMTFSHWTQKRDPQFKDPVLAALLSAVIPGLGQIYNYQFFKGLFIFLTCWLVIPYFLGIFDAYIQAERTTRTWQTVAVKRS